jgi:DNA-binding transcriptional regulator YdaS (Cro superfamily)
MLSFRIMQLRTFLENAPRGAGAALAKALGVHPVMVSQWAAGTKVVPLERCMDMERSTAGAVRRWDLRPHDWPRFWPELIGTEGAPDVPSAQPTAQEVG